MPSAASAPLNIGTGWTRAPMGSAPSPAAGQRPRHRRRAPGLATRRRSGLNQLVAAFDAMQPLTTLRLHGDCHLGNVLWRFHGDSPGPHVVDLDDAMQGPAMQDLWMLVSGDHATMAQQLNQLLGGYEQFCEFDDRERSLIEPLRTLRMLRHSAWLAERWSDPTFPQNFPHFSTPAYWSQQTAQLREQIELMGG
jgi:Ser/Thr protein kinase RdoA (MazF antagonist)